MGSVSTLTHLNGQCMITLLETQVGSADDKSPLHGYSHHFLTTPMTMVEKEASGVTVNISWIPNLKTPSPPYRGHRGPLRLSHNYSCSLLKRFACKTQLPFFKGIMKSSLSVLNFKVQISVYVFSHRVLVVLVVDGCAHLAMRTEKRKARPQLFSPGVEFVDPRFQDFLFLSSIYEFNFQFQICKDHLRV